jgi:hypothetical protein
MPESQAHTPHAEWPSLVPDFMFGTLFDSGRYAIDRWTHGLFALSDEINAFALARWQQDMETWRALANCRSVEDVVQCQCGFLQRAAADYMAEVGKLAQEMMGAAGAAFATPAQTAPQRQSWEVAPASETAPPSQEAPSRAQAAEPAHAADKPRRKRED